MTFLPIFENLHKMRALDCGTITFMNEKIQFLDSLMYKRLSYALKRCGFESSSVSFFLLSFNFASLARVHEYIYLNLSYAYSTNTHAEA